MDSPVNKEFLLFDPEFFHLLTPFIPPPQTLIQIQTTAMISSLTTSPHKRATVSASSALSIERQEMIKRRRKRKKREGNKQKYRKRKLKSVVYQQAEISTCTLKRLFVFILAVN